MKKSTSNIIRSFAIAFVLITVVVLVFQQFTFVSDYSYVSSCNKLTGCTSTDITACNQKLSAAEKTQGFDCDSTCKVRCSNTTEMRTLNTGYAMKCDSYVGGGAMVEAVGTCRLTEPVSHAKTVCSNGKTTTFSSTSGYPIKQQWEDWDMYYMTENDLLEEKKTDCSYACRQTTDLKAECVASKESPNNYVEQDHEGCYLYSNLWQVWWFDSENHINTRIEVCEDICKDAKCISSVEVEQPIDTEQPETVTTETTCEFGECTESVEMKCSNGESIIAYDCSNGCAVPTSNTCQNGVAPVGVCESYEILKDGQCVLSGKIVTDADTFVDYAKNNLILVSVIIGSIIIILVFVLTQTKKKYYR
jgi:hypothetical protein